MPAVDLAKHYDRWHDRRRGTETGASDDRLKQWVLDLTQVEPGMSVLDVACGQGGFLAAARARGAQLHGVDVSPVAIDIARSVVPEGEFRVGPAEELPYEDETFDRVTCIGSLEHFPDPEAGAAQIARVLKRDGRAVVFLPNLFFLGHVWFGIRHGTQPTEGEQGFAEQFLSREGWRDLLERGGLEVVDAPAWNTVHATQRVPALVARAWNAAARAHLVPRNGSYAFAYVCRKR